ncbi:hypothetical protein KSX_27000 [Ktedonospora formicarum]|uniref:Uncharacterized protein n=1 Tax=Ktedonospora formicarum TaxID=2778364 RepID=A0A8J3HUZ5_9CHLR|nr:hypothetical protein KSX_27000 [Ktedonospora formicarum]
MNRGGRITYVMVNGAVVAWFFYGQSVLIVYRDNANGQVTYAEVRDRPRWLVRASNMPKLRRTEMEAAHLDYAIVSNARVLRKKLPHSRHVSYPV